MKSIIIEYDLRAPGRDYNSLYSAIKTYGTYANITESTWFIKTNDSCIQVRDNLLAYMDPNDRLFVATLTGEAAWGNVICPSEFLRKNL